MVYGIPSPLASMAEAITGGALNALPYIVHGVAAGLSANSILGALKAGGMGVRRTSGLSLIKSVRGTTAAAQYQRGLAADEYPNPAFFNSSEGFLRQRFAYVVTVTGTNVFTGQLQTQGITISSQEALTNEQIDGYVFDIMEGSVSSYAMSVDDYELERVLVDPRFIP